MHYGYELTLTHLEKIELTGRQNTQAWRNFVLRRVASVQEYVECLRHFASLSTHKEVTLACQQKANELQTRIDKLLGN
jgi:hypothetical protein